ncbi:MAG: hypothetical protein N3B13_00610, partial [Deltaproteobacteria bacterium]|nr:hypothetical protein [Deltaproteobacteria bacterium]
SRNFSLAGVNGKGVINPGLWMRFKNDEPPLKLSLGIMKFYSDAGNINGKRDYGTEIDFVSVYSLFRFMDVSFEADYFLSGTFFKTGSENAENPFKILFAINLFL